MAEVFDKHPKPPYFAVIFRSKLSGKDREGYGKMADKILELAKQQPGYLGFDDIPRHEDQGLNVSYWQDEASIKAWKAKAEHLVAQKMGKDKWYQWFHLRVAKIERSYSFERDD